LVVTWGRGHWGRGRRGRGPVRGRGWGDDGVFQGSDGGWEEGPMKGVGEGRSLGAGMCAVDVKVWRA